MKEKKPEWFENGTMLVQAVTFDLAKYPKGLILLSINNRAGLAPIERITRDEEGTTDFPTFLAAEGRDCWAWFKVGKKELCIPLGSNLGERRGLKVDA